MGIGDLLKRGIKGITSAVADEVSSAIGVAAEMEKHPDE